MTDYSRTKIWEIKVKMMNKFWSAYTIDILLSTSRKIIWIIDEVLIAIWRYQDLAKDVIECRAQNVFPRIILLWFSLRNSWNQRDRLRILVLLWSKSTLKEMPIIWTESCSHLKSRNLQQKKLYVWTKAMPQIFNIAYVHVYVRIHKQKTYFPILTAWRKVYCAYLQEWKTASCIA